METAKRLQDTRRHATVECVPVPPKVAAKAPLYFKKSIDDAASEWAQHHAKRWIDTTAKVTTIADTQKRSGPCLRNASC